MIADQDLEEWDALGRQLVSIDPRRFFELRDAMRVIVRELSALGPQLAEIEIERASRAADLARELSPIFARADRSIVGSPFQSEPAPSGKAVDGG